MGKLDGRVAFITGAPAARAARTRLRWRPREPTSSSATSAPTWRCIGYPMATQDQLDETVKLVEEYGVRALGLQVDARDTDQVKAAVERTIDEFGRLDILLANHGIVDFSTVENDDRRVVEHDRRHQPDRHLQVHPGGHAADARGRVRPHRRDLVDGRPPDRPEPRALHRGQVGRDRPGQGCALEVADKGITVNAICPARGQHRPVLQPADLRHLLPGHREPDAWSSSRSG